MKLALICKKMMNGFSDEKIYPEELLYQLNVKSYGKISVDDNI